MNRVSATEETTAVASTADLPPTSSSVEPTLTVPSDVDLHVDDIEPPSTELGNIGYRTIECYDAFYKVRELEKKAYLEKIRETNQRFEKLNQLIGKFLALPQDKPMDMSQDPEAKALIEELKPQFPVLESKDKKNPYLYQNGKDILSFLMQRGDDLSKVSQETMLFLQEKSNEQKQLIEIIQKILSEFLDHTKAYLKLSSAH